MKSPDFDENMILPDVPCGHFALGTLSETCFKDAVFDINVRRHKLTKNSQVQNCQNWHKQSKTVSQPDTILSQLRHFDTWGDKKSYKKCYSWSRSRLK